MADRKTHGNGKYPQDELGPELRRAVEAIVEDLPPEDLVLRTLDRTRHRIAAVDAEGGPRPPSHRRIRRVVFSSLAGAACLGAVLIWLNRPAALVPLPQPIPVALPPRQMTIVPDLPTAWAYHQALGQSPEALESMLDRHAKQTLRPEPQSFQASVSPRYWQLPL